MTEQAREEEEAAEQLSTADHTRDGLAVHRMHCECERRDCSGGAIRTYNVPSSHTNNDGARCMQHNVDDVVALDVEPVHRKVGSKREHRQRAVALHARDRIDGTAPEIVPEERRDGSLGT